MFRAGGTKEIQAYSRAYEQKACGNRDEKIQNCYAAYGNRDDKKLTGLGLARVSARPIFPDSSRRTGACVFGAFRLRVREAH